jgi:anti-sigma factor RsiW
MIDHPVELIGPYADDELSPADKLRLEQHLANCTECARELALIRSITEALQRLANQPPHRSMWHVIEKKITQPLGWTLMVAGVAVWLSLGLIEWFRGELTLEWLATTAIGIGFALVLAGVAMQQYRDWRTSPYKDIHR